MSAENFDAFKAALMGFGTPAAQTETAQPKPVEAPKQAEVA